MDRQNFVARLVRNSLPILEPASLLKTGCYKQDFYTGRLSRVLHRLCQKIFRRFVTRELACYSGKSEHCQIAQDFSYLNKKPQTKNKNSNRKTKKESRSRDSLFRLPKNLKNQKKPSFTVFYACALNNCPGSSG